MFDHARSLGIGFSVGYAELTPEGHHYNTQILVDGDGDVVAKYRKIHIPGHDEPEPWRPFQHLERYYFEPGPEGFGVWPIMGGVIGMMICNDRRWPETYRVMALDGVEMILCGYNTPIHYAPDPSQDVLQGFHNALVMQAGAYQNGTFVVAAAKGGLEEGVESLAQSCVIAPIGSDRRLRVYGRRRARHGGVRPRLVRPLQKDCVRLRSLSHDRALRTDRPEAGTQFALRIGQIKVAP